MVRRFTLVIMGVLLVVALLVFVAVRCTDGEGQQSVDKTTWSMIKSVCRDRPGIDISDLDWNEGGTQRYVNDRGQCVTLKCWEVDEMCYFLVIATKGTLHPEIEEVLVPSGGKR